MYSDILFVLIWLRLLYQEKYRSKVSINPKKKILKNVIELDISLYAGQK
jgi:hypothetical protein